MCPSQRAWDGICSNLGHGRWVKGCLYVSMWVNVCYRVHEVYERDIRPSQRVWDGICSNLGNGVWVTGSQGTREGVSCLTRYGGGEGGSDFNEKWCVRCGVRGCSMNKVPTSEFSPKDKSTIKENLRRMVLAVSMSLLSDRWRME